MTIRQQGGVFGRNPTFNDVTVEGDLNVGGSFSINGEVFGGLNFEGTWDANANSPNLTTITPVTGQFWIVSTGGATDLDGITNWGVGDWALYDGSTWRRVEGGADGNFVNLNASGTVSFAGAAVSDLGSVATADINGGTIDGVTIATSDITVGSGKTLDVSAGTLTLANGQISGDAINGGTIGSVTITSADINGGSVDGVTLGTNSAVTEAQIDNININGNAITSTDTDGNIALTPNGTGEVDISKVDIDGGTVDGTVIGGSTPAAISGTTGTFSGELLVGRADNGTYSGNVHATGFSSVGTSQFNIQASSSGANFEWVLRTGSEMHFYVNNASVVATLSSSGVWTNASDRRYKENIRPASYGLAEVMQLQPRSYNIVGSEKQEIGFIAQEVQPIVPELVESHINSVTGEDRLSLSYSQLSAVLAKAIQEQQAIIEALEARVAALEA